MCAHQTVTITELTLQQETRGDGPPTPNGQAAPSSRRSSGRRIGGAALEPRTSAGGLETARRGGHLPGMRACVDGWIYLAWNG